VQEIDLFQFFLFWCVAKAQSVTTGLLYLKEDYHV
jgi:hypothetical protein